MAMSSIWRSAARGTSHDSGFINNGNKTAVSSDEEAEAARNRGQRLYRAALNSALSSMFRGLPAEHAAEEQEYRDEDGDPENTDRDAMAAAEAQSHA